MASTQHSSWDLPQRFPILPSMPRQNTDYGHQTPAHQALGNIIPIDSFRAPTSQVYNELRLLQGYYTFLDRDAIVIEFLKDEMPLYLLLIDAVDPIQSVFGKHCNLHAKVLSSDEDSLLKVAVQLPASFEDPQGALRSFEQNWWLNNCHRSGAGLVFDYEIQDAL